MLTWNKLYSYTENISLSTDQNKAFILREFIKLQTLPVQIKSIEDTFIQMFASKWLLKLI